MESIHVKTRGPMGPTYRTLWRRIPWRGCLI
jgi:hypothetical protein